MLDYDLQIKRASAIQKLLDNNPDLPLTTKRMQELKLRRIAATEEELRHNMRNVG